MFIIQAGPMVIHLEINSHKKNQSFAEVQKTIALYYFTLVSKFCILVSKFRAGDGKKAWCLSSMLVLPAIRSNENIQNY